MENCIFCKIANGLIPSNIVYEDDVCVAFLDLNQSQIGHTLIVPKDHFTNFLDINHLTLNHIMGVTKKIAKSMIGKNGIEGFNIINNCNEVAGQSVMHFHLHLIPRYKNDSFKFIEGESKLSEEEINNLKEEIKNGLL